MTKLEFLAALKGRLDGLSDADVKKSLEFYSEMIDDRVEEGLTEEEAVKEIGSPIDVADKIIAEMPLTTVIKAKIKSKGKLNGYMIALIAVLSPVIFSLLLAFSITYIVLVSVLWSLLAILIGLVVGFILGGLGGIVISIIQACTGLYPSFVFILSASLILLGLGLLLLLTVKYAIKGTILLTSKSVTLVKRLIIK